MRISPFMTALCAAILLGGGPAVAQDVVPAEFRGAWVPASGSCASPLRFHVGSRDVTLINRRDRATYGDVEIAHSFFGPEYRGTSVAAIPEFSGGEAPFTIFFNYDGKKGRTVLDIYHEMKGALSPKVAALQAAAKRLAERFPLHMVELRKCAS